MPRELEEMPLFPLNTVLFPYSTMQVHIFEDRYLEMVRHCLEFDRGFGVALIRSGSEVGGPAEPFLVGTAVHIDTVHHLDDGKMDLVIRGERRFRIREFDDSAPYLIGRVEPVYELEISPQALDSDKLRQFRHEFEAFIKSYFTNQDFSVKVKLDLEPQALSFLVASFLQLPNLDRQRILETTDTMDRIDQIFPILQNLNLESRDTLSYRLPSPDRSSWIQPN